MLGQLYQRTLKKFSADDESFNFVCFNQPVSDYSRHCRLPVDKCTRCSLFRSCCDIYTDSILSHCFLLHKACFYYEYISKLLYVHDFACINNSFSYISLFGYICSQGHSDGVTGTNKVSSCNVSTLNVSCQNREKDQACFTDHDKDDIHCTCCKDPYNNSDYGTLSRCYFQCVNFSWRVDLFGLINEWLNIMISFSFFAPSHESANISGSIYSLPSASSKFQTDSNHKSCLRAFFF